MLYVWGQKSEIQCPSNTLYMLSIGLTTGDYLVMAVPSRFPCYEVAMYLHKMLGTMLDA